MYAVIKTGGKQYRVTEGDILEIEKIEQEEGSTIDFDQVLMVHDGEAIKIGAPFVEGSKVSATIEQQKRGPKVKIMKFRRRKHHMKQMGHRQYLTRVKITGITL